MDTAAISAALISGIGVVAGAIAYSIRLYWRRKAGIHPLTELVIEEQDIEVGGASGHPTVTVRSRANSDQPQVVVHKNDGSGFSEKEAAAIRSVSRAWLSFSQRRREVEAGREASDSSQMDV